MQITYRIPSKKVPYGYVEIVDSNAAMPQPDELAQWYANYIKMYQAAEVAAFERPAPVKAEDRSVEEATKMLDEGLGVTEIDESEPVKPWDKSADESTTESKPWETNAGDWDFS